MGDRVTIVCTRNVLQDKLAFSFYIFQVSLLAFVQPCKCFTDIIFRSNKKGEYRGYLHVFHKYKNTKLKINHEHSFAVEILFKIKYFIIIFIIIIILQSFV